MNCPSPESERSTNPDNSRKVLRTKAFKVDTRVSSFLIFANSQVKVRGMGYNRLSNRESELEESFGASNVRCRPVQAISPGP